jgi:Polyketide cyclase / dehydrase and lipid transport
MIEISENAEYDLPADAIFAALTDFASYPSWQEAVESATLLDSPVRVGARVTVLRKEMGWRGTVNVTVAELVPGELLTLATVEGTKPSVRQSYQLTSEGGGCRLRYALALDGMPKMFEPIARAQLRRQVPRMLRRLAENTAVAPGSPS